MQERSTSCKNKEQIPSLGIYRIPFFPGVFEVRHADHAKFEETSDRNAKLRKCRSTDCVLPSHCLPNWERCLAATVPSMLCSCSQHPLPFLLLAEDPSKQDCQETSLARKPLYFICVQFALAKIDRFKPLKSRRGNWSIFLTPGSFMGWLWLYVINSKGVSPKAFPDVASAFCAAREPFSRRGWWIWYLREFASVNHV